ncbi:MAG: glycoside hydrolase family 3 C-terminal domain-containing protein, partial [Treponema sp.]|nr:glycoside hydrolase family 3 C-terminal domain-containing protein [Treponema sp.]
KFMDVEKLLSELTLEEKAAFCSGLDFSHTKPVERLGIPAVDMRDGPHGLRKQVGNGDRFGIGLSLPSVCFPTASAVAASFDEKLVEKAGMEMGAEYRAENVAMQLGPAINIKRSPLCGRNFEYWSEDPYLAGKLGAAIVRGVQNTGTASCVKHYAANNQETLRMTGNSVVDERTLHEIYLTAFETIVKESKPHSVMCAYNQVNGIFCAENRYLLTELLRDKWGFDGFVVTDWGAVKDRVKGIKAGLDLEMPGGSDESAKRIIAAIQSGELAEDELNTAVRRILKFVLDSERNQGETQYDLETGYQASLAIAKQCAVLLKNSKDTLPLDKKAKVAFIGEFANKTRYQGAGSSFVNSAKTVSALQTASGLNISYAQGYKIKSDVTDDSLLAEAVEAARNTDVAVIFAGLTDRHETEGADRDNLDIPANQNVLISAVVKVQPNTVVVLHNGSPVTMPWIDEIPAVLEMYLTGDGSGEAAVSILFGDTNPSGKLAETFPKKLSDTPSFLNFPGERGTVEYREGVFVGYRYYDKKEAEVLFPFGHGLSYTTFEYGNLRINKSEVTDTEILVVTVSVKNTGKRSGMDAVQLYVKNPNSKVIRPVRELRAFVKVELQSGESKDVTFTLDKRAFAYWETRLGDFAVESGIYGIEIAASSRDIRLSTSVMVKSTAVIPYRFTRYSTFGEVGESPKGKAMLEAMMQQNSRAANYDISGLGGEGAEVLSEKTMQEMPLGTLVSYEMITEEQLDGMLSMLNS